MKQTKRSIRGIDDDAWRMLVAVCDHSRTQTGALVSEAIRFWYEYLEEDAGLDEDDG